MINFDDKLSDDPKIDKIKYKFGDLSDPNWRDYFQDGFKLFV